RLVWRTVNWPRPLPQMIGWSPQYRLAPKWMVVSGTMLLIRPANVGSSPTRRAKLAATDSFTRVVAPSANTVTSTRLVGTPFPVFVTRRVIVIPPPTNRTSQLPQPRQGQPQP